MANSTFGNLKIKCLRRGGNNYNANDATLLTIMGGIINEVMGEIQTYLKGHPYTLSIGNTVDTVAATAYAALAQTDIIEILQFYQRTSNSKLRQYTWQEYIEMVPNPTVFGGVPDAGWAPSQAINGSGQNIWTPYFIPTPSSAITMYYDYVKNLQFSADTSSADAEFSKLPNVYDYWIIAETKPKLIEVLDPKNFSAIAKAEQSAHEKRIIAMQSIWSQVDRYYQAGSARSGAYGSRSIRRSRMVIDGGDAVQTGDPIDGGVA